MKKIMVNIFVFLLLLPILLCFNVLAEEKDEPEVLYAEKYENGYRYNIQGWIYLYIEGNGYDRGFQHGYLLAAEIVDHILRWSNVIHNSPRLEKKHYDFESDKYGQISGLWWDFCRKNIERIYWDRTPSEYQDEMKGIADGVKERGGKVFGRAVDYIDILSINQLFEFMIRNENIKKGFHPFRDLFNELKDLISTGLGDEDGFVQSVLDEPPTDHCNAFIATGDATKDGQLVAAHNIRCGGWWYPYYIAQRWNVILDIQPDDGYRLIMHSSPGFIWSDANYYQNEEGIVVMDTTCPQGLWKNKGYSMVIRTRLAAQYSENLDEAINYLMEKNDGFWTAAYLIGDSETGEIARLDLSLYNYELWRTFDGFYWSANNIMNVKIRAEANGLGIKAQIMKLLGMKFYPYFTLRYMPAPRDLKLEERGNKYYGDIDIEVLKEGIMTPFPIVDSSTTDLKATDTYLMAENCLWAFWGNAGGMIWDVSNYEMNLKGGKNVPPAGWTFISGIPKSHDVQLPEDTTEIEIGSYKSKILWDYDFAEDFEGRNMWYANLAYSNDTIYTAGLDGKIYAFDAETGKKQWIKKINDYGGMTWINAEKDRVIICWENETNALDPQNGDIDWTKHNIKYVSSQPVFLDDKIIIGTREGDIYSIDSDNGKAIWYITLEPQKIYLSVDKKRDSIIVTNNKKCYSINAEDGEIKWTFDTDGIIVSQPLVVDDTIFVGSCDTNLYAINARTGEEKWRYLTGWSIITTPTYSNNMIYTASADHHIYAINANNAELQWTFKANAAIHSSPIAYGDFIFFGCDDGRYYAIDKTNGEIAWQHAPGETINDDIYNYITTAVVGNSIAKDSMIFTSANGMIFGFDAQTFQSENLARPIGDKIDEKTGFMIIITLITIIIILVIGIYISRRKKK